MRNFPFVGIAVLANGAEAMKTEEKYTEFIIEQLFRRSPYNIKISSNVKCFSIIFILFAKK